MKRTGILLYRRNLNKAKFYTRTKKIILIRREDVLLKEKDGVFTIDRNDRLYRREIHCANSAAGPTSFIFFNVCG